jgi:O-methyltransferase
MTLPKYTKIRSKKDIVKIFPKDFLPIFKKDKIIQLYFEGIKKSKNSQNDNFPKLMRFFSMMQVVSHVLKKRKVYDFVECGCWKGHSSYLISKLIYSSQKRLSFHIFDSFEGLSKSTIEDSLYHRKRLDDKKRISNFFSSNENFVKNYVLKSFSFVKTYKGWIPSKFYQIKNKKFSFIHVDVDLYKPTIESLSFFYPRLVDGGVMVCDDYNVTGFPGAKKAWDDFFKNKKIKFFFQNPLGGCFIIK